MRRTSLMLLSILHALSLWGAASEPSIYLPFWYALRRVEVPKMRFIDGGAHNSVHVSCENDGVFAHGYVSAGEELDCKNVAIPIDDPNAILFSHAGNVFALFQAQTRQLILRKYAKGRTDVYEDSELQVKGAQPIEGSFPVVIEVRHGGIVECKSTQAGVGKSAKAVPVVVLPGSSIAGGAAYPSYVQGAAYHSQQH